MRSAVFSRLAGLWVLLSSGLSGAAMAQQEAAPLISLPFVEQAPAPVEGPVILEELSSAPTGAVPVIQLQPVPPSAQHSAPLLGESATVVVLPARDRAPAQEAGVLMVEAPTAAEAGWRLPLSPATPLPEGVDMGASLVSPTILRLSGERVKTTLMLELPSNQPPAQSFDLVLRSSIHVLPDLAGLQLRVNEAEPIELPLDALGDFEVLSIVTDALQPGQNRITLELSQPHRIFCGPEASFGVWTEIALDQSGVLLSKDGLSADAAGFALAARAQAAMGKSLEILTEVSVEQALVRALAEPLSQALGPQGRIEQRSFYRLGGDPIASVALIASDRVFAEIRRGSEGGLVLQVEHMDGQLPDLSVILQAFPPIPETRTPLLQPGETTPLSALGQGNIIGNTHYFRHDVSFALPQDWLLMANQKARLDLHYGFARSLPEGAILLIKVNGETVRLLPLDHDGGQLQPRLPIGFNANLLRSGRNRLSFEMMVPGNPAEAVCQSRSADLLVVRDDTTLEVPPSPSMVLPGLAAALLRLSPKAVVEVSGALDPQAAGQQAFDVASALAMPERSLQSVRLQVVGYKDFGMLPLEDAGLSLATVQKLLFPPQLAQADMPQVSATGAQEPPSSADFRLNDSLEPIVVNNGPGMVERLWAGFTPLEWLEREAHRLYNGAFVNSTLTLSQWAEGRHGTALLLRPNPEVRGQMWLLLGPSANAQAVGKALTNLRDDALAQGEAALLQSDGSWQVWSPIMPPRLLAWSSLGGLWTALGNFASWSPLLFTFTLLSLALLSTVPALLYILFSRRHRGGK